jgi:catechol 2,3-dioxygenase-like lactoylglutathione lyase family enzyme
MQTRQLVPMVFVADVERSIKFYAHLGFEAGNTFTQEGATKPSWAWLSCCQAQLMLASAGSEEIVVDQQRVLFYLYTDDVAAAQKSLAEKGLNPGEISTPFYAPRGEFKLVDPDRFTLMITHT